MSKLFDISVIIPTMLRPGYLRETLRSLSLNLPEAEVIVVCDDPITKKTDFKYWSQWLDIPIDAGLPCKRNFGVSAANNDFILMGSDDFDFTTVGCRPGVRNMLQTLDDWPNVDVVCGTYAGRHYERKLEYKAGEYIKETPVPGAGPKRIDLGANWFLARTQVCREVDWDVALGPIGGEHADWFLRLKNEGKVVVWIPDAPIEPFSSELGLEQSPDYAKLRNRAFDGHKIFLTKWGVKKYVSA